MGKLVRGEGSQSSKLYIIGEAPGAMEDSVGRPFVGGAGQVLDGMLHEVGIKRAECYIDNVIQERPLNNDFSIYYSDSKLFNPTEALLSAHRRLRDLIQLNKPNVVIALGNEALFALTGRKGITKWRGSILSCNGIKVVPSIHPAMIMRQYEFRPQAIFDLSKAKTESKSPNFPPSCEDHFLVDPTYEQIIDTLKSLRAKEKISFDIETIGNQIICIGLGWSEHDAICIPFFFGDKSYWTSIEEMGIIKELRELFLDPKIKMIAQNAQFDMTFIWEQWKIEPANLWMDTMVAHHCAYTELPKSLAFMTSIYTGRNFYKDMFSEKGSPRTLWIYNCLDCVSTWESAEAIRNELEEFGTWNFYQKHSHKLIKPLWRMQLRGVKIDLLKREHLRIKFEGALEILQAKLNKTIGHELNPSSPKQMKEFLYKELGIPEHYHQKTGNISADHDTLIALAKSHPHPAFEIILEIRRINKLLNTYINVKVDDDGRIRCSYSITGTETGRLSSRESVFGSGTNLQNIPRDKEIRSIFIPDEGSFFVNADLSQAEARLVAFLAQERRLQIIFEEGGDIHKKNASMVFNKPISEINEDERQLAKKLVHAANYGIGKRKFARLSGVSETKAAQLLNQYYATYPAIKVWHKQIEEELQKKRILETPLGRKRIFFGRFDQELIRAAVAFVPQATASDIINQGLVAAWNNLPDKWEILLQVHDSLLMQVPKGTNEMLIKKFVERFLQIPVEINNKTLVIPVEIKTGYNWGELEKLKL